MTAAPRTDHAFSLVEVVIALGLFAFCIVALINLLTVGIQATGQTEERLEAANIAQQLLEMRRIHPGSNVVALSKWGLPPITSTPTNGSNAIGEDGYTGSANPAYQVTFATYLPALTTATNTTNGKNTNCVNVYLMVKPLHTTGKLRPYELISTITLQ